MLWLGTRPTLDSGRMIEQGYLSPSGVDGAILATLANPDATAQLAELCVDGIDNAIHWAKDAVDGDDDGDGGSHDLDPADLAGKTAEETDRLAREAGLIAKGPDPANGKGAYVAPETGEQRVLIHPNDPNGPHMHVNDRNGQRIDIDGNPIGKNRDGAHLPLG